MPSQGCARHYQRDRAPDLERDESLRQLLDHIAAELAEEYVRLMEATAVEEGRARTTVLSRKSHGGE